MTRFSAVEKERSLIALLVSLALHLVVILIAMMIPGSELIPERPKSVPIQVSFTLPEPPVPEPTTAELPPPEPQEVAPQPEPVPRPVPRSSAPSTGSVEPEYEPWTPEPEQDFQQSFSSSNESTRDGGRISRNTPSDSRTQFGETEYQSGAEKGDDPVIRRSSSGDTGSQALSDSQLAELDRALARGGRSGESAAGQGPVITDVDNVGSIDNLESVLSYRNARYSGLPGLDDNSAAELSARKLSVLTVDISFTISPDGSVEDLQTSASSGYPSLDAFLQKNLPRVLRFAPLPKEYGDLRQQVRNLELVVKSN
jgi:outer membrane biosynthesis protein TonB